MLGQEQGMQKEVEHQGSNCTKPVYSGAMIARIRECVICSVCCESCRFMSSVLCFVCVWCGALSPSHLLYSCVPLGSAIIDCPCSRAYQAFFLLILRFKRAYHTRRYFGFSERIYMWITEILFLQSCLWLGL